jgi:hypothetical protein
VTRSWNSLGGSGKYVLSYLNPEYFPPARMLEYNLQMRDIAEILEVAE